MGTQREAAATSIPAELKRLRHWEPSIAALLAGVLFIPLPEAISPGPGWLPAVAVAALLLPLTLLQEARRRPGGWEPSVRALRLMAIGVVVLLALAEAGALVQLLNRLPSISQGGLLFRSAALIWLINLLLFAICYWELDGGGPARRAQTDCPPGDFLFPQQMNDHLSAGWAPEFLDYVFLAFNTSTAFSPTDTMILSRPAKALMMAQASIALLTIGLVVARAVNIIGK